MLCIQWMSVTRVNKIHHPRPLYLYLLYIWFSIPPHRQIVSASINTTFLLFVSMSDPDGGAGFLLLLEQALRELKNNRPTTAITYLDK